MFEMSSEVISIIIKIAAILVTAVVVKTIDDVLDLENPYESPFAAFFQRGTLPYMIAIFSLALVLHFETAFTLFWASYTIGMVRAPLQMLPTGVTGAVEIVIGILILIVVSGCSSTIWGLTVILAVQCMDDLLDQEVDNKRKGTNIALTIGQGECFLLFIIALYTAVTLQPLESTAAFVTALWIGNGFSGKEVQSA